MKALAVWNRRVEVSPTRLVCFPARSRLSTCPRDLMATWRSLWICAATCTSLSPMQVYDNGAEPFLTLPATARQMSPVLAGARNAPVRSACS